MRPLGAGRLVTGRRTGDPDGARPPGAAAAGAGLAGRLAGLGALLPLLAAGVAGALMAVQGTLNSVLSKVIGLLEASFLAQLLGGAVAALLLYVLRLGSGNIAALGRAPWFTLLAGPIGLAIIYGVAFGISKVGVAPATTAIIIGQVSTAVLIDSFGLFGAERVPFCWTKILGVVLLAGAGWLMLRKA